MTAQLPPAGETTESRPAEAPPTDALSIAEASARYGVSTSTLRRRLAEEAIAGAFQVPGPKGPEWRLPPGSLEALGYVESATVALAEAAPAAAPSADLSAVLVSLATLTDALASEHRQLVAAEEDRHRAQRDREEARIDAARLGAQLEAAQAKVADLEARLDAATTRRRWFRRGPKPS